MMTKKIVECWLVGNGNGDGRMYHKGARIAFESSSLAECQEKLKQLSKAEQEAINSMCEFRERRVKQ